MGSNTVIVADQVRPPLPTGTRSWHQLRSPPAGPRRSRVLVGGRRSGPPLLTLGKTSIAALAAVEAEVAVDDAMADNIMGDNMGVAADAMDVGV